MDQRAVSTKAIEKATGVEWEVWLARLNKIGAKTLSHSEIAKALKEKGYVKKSDTWPVGKNFNAGWWRQSITVAYEQAIKRRLPGQMSDGSFAISVNKTLPETLDNALRWWQGKINNKNNFNGVFVTKSSHSKTEKWRYWRANLADGSKINVTITAKTNDKVSFSLGHEIIKSQKQASMWKIFWSNFLK